jgi:hypothetical protein
MNQSKFTIENAFVGWGKSQSRLPSNNEVLKNEIIQRLNLSVPVARRKKTFSIPWMSLAFSSFALLLLIVQASHNSISGNKIFIGQQESASTFDQKALPEQSKDKKGLNYDLTAPSNALPFRSEQRIKEDLYAAPTQNSGQIPLSDSREFLKTDYSTSIQSRHVQKTTDRLQTTIRGFGGRVDSATNSEKNGYINFAIPASKLDAFKAEVKNIAGEKFVNESMQMQNMLPEKQSIEEQQRQTNEVLENLKKDRDSLIAEHTKTVGSLNAQISRINKQLSKLQTELQNYPEREVEINTKKQQLLNSRGALQRQLANENANYSSNLNYYDSQIENSEVTLKSLDKQNTNLLDTVATVRGTISVNYISTWDVLNLYVQIGWIIFILFGASIGALVIHYNRKHKLVLP